MHVLLHYALITVAFTSLFQLLPRCVYVYLYVQLPSHTDIANNEFFLTIQSSMGEMFMDKQLISFSSSSRGMIVVKTDKPIYKPNQTGKCQ